LQLENGKVEGGRMERGKERRTILFLFGRANLDFGLLNLDIYIGCHYLYEILALNVVRRLEVK
jgi:hypothetical protein